MVERSVVNWFGFVNVNKPRGISSRKVVDRVARLAKPAKAGHAGTLDPIATGVLVIGVGQATRLVEYVQRRPKRYIGTFQLGRTSETEDVEGTVVELDSPPIPTRDEIVAAAEKWTGEISQRPPAFSALKVDGRRAYELARQGKAVELAARPVTIYRLEVARYEYPELELHVECSSGTYIRSLGRDLAESLGTAAVMSDLVRTAVGDFRLEDACPWDALRPETFAEHLLPALDAVAWLPRVELSAVEIRAVQQGRMLARDVEAEGEEFAAVDSSGRLAALLARVPGGLRPTRCFPARD